MRLPGDLRVGDTVQYKERQLSVSDQTGEIVKVYKTKPGICKVYWEKDYYHDDPMDELERVDTV